MSDNKNSVEISTKIRSAIKAKLMELGAYVDEELPDYIMVMIANKKTNQQMSEDLNLFLGKNSPQFTEWLQGVLERLQTISRSNASTTIAQAVSESMAAKVGGPVKKDESNRSTTTYKEKEKERKESPDRKRKYVGSRRSRDEKASSRNRKRRDSSDEKSSPSSHSPNHGRRRGKRPEKNEPSRQSILKIEKRSGERSSMEKVKMESSIPENSRSHGMGRADDDILVLREEVDEGDELSTNVGQIKNDTVTVSQEQLDQPKRVVTVIDKPMSGPTVVSALGSNVRKPIEAPSPDASTYGRRHVGTVRPMKRRTPSPDEGPSRKRRSAIGQVIQHPPQDDGLNEEYDPLRPHINPTSTATVLSTVHVTERKYTVPRDMQPKSSIFLRALNDANRSVTKVSRRHESTTDDKESRQQTSGKYPVEEEDRRRRRVEETDRPGGIFRHATGESGDRSSEKPITRRIQLRGRTELTEGKHSTKSFHPERMEDECLIIDSSGSSSNASNQSKQDTGPHFVVTMSGVDRKFMERFDTREEIKTEEIEDYDDDNDDMDTLIVNVNEQELMEEAMMAGLGSNKPTPPVYTPVTQVVNPIKISLDDDEDEDEFDEKELSTVVVSRPQSVHGSNEPIDVTQQQIDGTLSGGGGNKILERCRYWPSCKSGSLCSYHHPTINCKNFPQCRFGDKCYYIHPPCKFGLFCKNTRCFYFHNRHTTPQISQQQTAAQVPCKFGERCMNLTCPFIHTQTQCKYGSSCTNANCAYSHRGQPTMPGYQQPRAAVQQRSMSTGRLDKSKFRWVSQQSINVDSGPIKPISEMLARDGRSADITSK